MPTRASLLRSQVQMPLACRTCSSSSITVGHQELDAQGVAAPGLVQGPWGLEGKQLLQDFDEEQAGVQQPHGLDCFFLHAVDVPAGTHRNINGQRHQLHRALKGPSSDKICGDVTRNDPGHSYRWISNIRTEPKIQLVNVKRDSEKIASDS